MSSVTPTVAGPTSPPVTSPITYTSVTPSSTTPARLLAIADAYLADISTVSTPTNMTPRQPNWGTTQGAALVTSPTAAQKYGLGLFDESVTASVSRSRTFGGSGMKYWLSASVLLYPPASSVNRNVNLTWGVTPDAYATGYEMARAPATTPATNSISGRTTLTWSDTSTSASTAYTYTVAAVYTSGGAHWQSTTLSANVTTTC